MNDQHFSRSFSLPAMGAPQHHKRLTKVKSLPCRKSPLPADPSLFDNFYGTKVTLAHPEKICENQEKVNDSKCFSPPKSPGSERQIFIAA
mmetsp:Transcript_37249/g.87630  ORF Transcript_37249/g.87630 Transcript_37249/m.87630 type:complete len:90 (-) Transcript_37249:669-938(-)|eukprot:2102851-Rhodomonas_salina.1